MLWLLLAVVCQMDATCLHPDTAPNYTNEQYAGLWYEIGRVSSFGFDFSACWAVAHTVRLFISHFISAIIYFFLCIHVINMYITRTCFHFRSKHLAVLFSRKTVCVIQLILPHPMSVSAMPKSLMHAETMMSMLVSPLFQVVLQFLIIILRSLDLPQIIIITFNDYYC